MSRVPRLRNTVWVLRVLFELVLKDDWSVLGSSQGRSLCSKISLQPYLRERWRGQDWEELRLWVWGGDQLGMRGVPGWLQSWLQVAPARTVVQVRGTWAGECIFFFDGSSEGRAEDFIILLAPKSVGGQHARVKQDQGRYLPEDVTSLGLVVRNSVWGVRPPNT